MLINAGAGPELRIAVLLEPSADTYVALIAILYPGGVFIPLDTGLPSSRNETILKACDPRFLVMHHHATSYMTGDLITVDISDVSFSPVQPTDF